MTYQRYKITGGFEPCDEDTEWWYWWVQIDHQEWADGVSRSREDAARALDYAIEQADRAYNREGQKPEFDLPFYP